jgi:hypothetical protein
VKNDFGSHHKRKISNAYGILMGKRLGKYALGISRSCVYNIKMILSDIDHKVQDHL